MVLTIAVTGTPPWVFDVPLARRVRGCRRCDGMPLTTGCTGKPVLNVRPLGRLVLRGTPIGGRGDSTPS
jgi:hypothetical protein